VFLAGPRSVLNRPTVSRADVRDRESDRESHERDYVKKRKEYHRLGVLEYVIIDRLRHRVTVYTAARRGYRKRVVRRATSTQPSLARLVIPLAEIFDGLLDSDGGEDHAGTAENT